MLKRKLFIIILMTACFKAGLIAAQEDFIDVAIFPVYTGDMQHDEILKACEFMTEEAFSASKRFLSSSAQKS